MRKERFGLAGLLMSGMIGFGSIDSNRVYGHETGYVHDHDRGIEIKDSRNYETLMTMGLLTALGIAVGIVFYSTRDSRE